MEKADPQVVGARVRIARLLQERTQADLAKQLEVTPAFVCQLEAGTRQPGPALLAALSVVLRVEPEFFARHIQDEFRDEECFFRKRKTTPMYARSRALAHGSFLTELISLLEHHVDFPEENVPNIPGGAKPVDVIAEECRIAWDLGIDTPIVNMTRVLENAGVVVADFGSHRKVDAFSRAGARAVVARNTETQARSRLRFDLAHECGHLVMHAGQDASNPELEPAADAFAGAFLLPRRAFVAEFPSTSSPSWQSLRELKRRWGVSLSAIIRRARELRLIDALFYQRAYKQMSARGWNTNEPDEHLIEDEKPELITTALRMLDDAGEITLAELAGRLGWAPDLFTEITGEPCEPLPDDVIPIDRARRVRAGV
ncbi:MAG: XRE family transcriptional regulator [Kofleriaceae bacterium]|nr:XRE family transcriptional regulator [Kofleriaceae bacterium]